MLHPISLHCVGDTLVEDTMPCWVCRCCCSAVCLAVCAANTSILCKWLTLTSSVVADVKAADMAAHGAVPPGIDARMLPGDGGSTLLQQFHSAVPPPARGQQQRAKPELSAADVLLQISHSPSSNMPTSLAPSDQVCILTALERLLILNLDHFHDLVPTT